MSDSRDDEVDQIASDESDNIQHEPTRNEVDDDESAMFQSTECWTDKDISVKVVVNSATERICKNCLANYLIRRITGPIRGRQELTSYQNLKADPSDSSREIVRRIDVRVGERTLLVITVFSHLCFALLQLVHEFT